MVYSISSKQKLNTKSSTEAELVAINDSMEQVLWTRHFVVAQGEHSPSMTIYQDSKSTILLAENGKTSSSRRTRHLVIRYFFARQNQKGQSDNCVLSHTGHVKGFLKKPLQGAQAIQNSKSVQQFKYSCSQECVGAKDKNGWLKEKMRSDRTTGKANLKTAKSGTRLVQIHGFTLVE